MSDICYGSQRIITIVGTAMKHGRHLAGIGLERFGNGKDVRLLAKASPQRSRRVCVSQCQEMCTRRRTASFHSFSDESVDSTSLHELLSIQQNTNNWPEGEMQFIQGIMDGFQHIWQVAKSALVQPR